MKDDELMDELTNRGLALGGAGVFNREVVIELLRENDAMRPERPEVPHGYLTPIQPIKKEFTKRRLRNSYQNENSAQENTGILKNLSNISSGTEPGSEKRREATELEERKRTAMAIALRNARNRGETIGEIGELFGVSFKNNDDHDEDEDELTFLADELDPYTKDDYNICTEAQLIGLEDEDRVLGYLYDISEGDESSSNGKSVVQQLIDRFTEEITEDVSVTSQLSQYGSTNESTGSQLTDSSDILSRFSATGVLNLLREATQLIAQQEELEGQNESSFDENKVIVPIRPVRELRQPKRYAEEVFNKIVKVLSTPRRGRLSQPIESQNTNSGSAGLAVSQDTLATCARAALRDTTKVRIEHNPAPSQAKKIHGINANLINGDSICSLCGFPLRLRQPPDEKVLKWSYDHTIPVNLVALYFRIICSGNNYSQAEVEIMSHLGDVSCWNCNYIKLQARFISIPIDGPAFPIIKEIEKFLNNLLIIERKDGKTKNGKSKTIVEAIKNINTTKSYNENLKLWKEIQTENLKKKVQQICNLLNEHVDKKKARAKLAKMGKHIKQCQAVAKRNERLKSTAFKQILAYLSTNFPWKEKYNTKWEKNRKSIKRKTYNFQFDTQIPGFYSGFIEAPTGNRLEKPVPVEKVPSVKRVSGPVTGVIRRRNITTNVNLGVLPEASPPKRSPQHPELTIETVAGNAGFDYINAPGNGNCLFGATAIAFAGSPLSAAELREGEENLRNRVVQDMIDNRNIIEPSLNVPFDKYIQRMLNDREWAGQYEIVALERVLGRCINVWILDELNNRLIIYGGGQYREGCLNIFYNGVNHYDALLPVAYGGSRRYKQRKTLKNRKGRRHTRRRT